MKLFLALVAIEIVFGLVAFLIGAGYGMKYQIEQQGLNAVREMFVKKGSTNEERED